MQPSATHPQPAPPAPMPTESVTRPESGLARGRWEAPSSFFWAILAAVLAFALVYLLRRLGLLRVKKREEPQPASTRARRP